MTRVLILGATSAIAQAVARLMAADGAEFHLVARHADRLRTIAADLTARGAGKVGTTVADLADRQTHEAVIQDARRSLDQIDLVLLAFGTLGDHSASIGDSTVAEQELVTNFLAPAAILARVANQMEAAGRGTIAVIGSVAGDRGRQSNYVYGSAKAGLAAFVQGLRHRLWAKGVRVMLIKPGFVDTPMTAAIPGRGGPLWATPERVARDIHQALAGTPPVLYTPWFWRWIMLIVRLVPDAVFRRTRL
jgi:decaprenylphospho-beta-D-erythro-pentofuranosid-2-ulose 2-reductase